MLLVLSACQPDAPALPVADPVTGTLSATASGLVASAIPVPTLTSMPEPTSTLMATPVPSALPTLTPGASPTASAVPTYAILRGQVLPERANCRYGAGAMYLYKYGLVGGSNLEVIGRNELGSWILIRAIGGTNSCWVKASLMELRGDVLSLEPFDPHVILPWSPYYRQVTGVQAWRDGSMVIVEWHTLPLRAGDQADPVRYVVEAWVCRDGELVFDPVGVNFPRAEILDEPGCRAPSHGRVLAAEKHGYTLPVEIPWP